MDEIKVFLRKRLTAHDANISWQSETMKTNFSNLSDLLMRTCTCGESNSVLVIGSRGAGKTHFVTSVIEDLMADKNIANNSMQVHLNGFLHTDDRTCLKEITVQLQLENVLGDKVFGSFQENLLFLLESFKAGGCKAKSIIFILEEFDLFCHHKNQTLLYNLFDIVQSPQTTIAVVGVTTRLDVTELMEKRVKSRFSYRQIHIIPTYTFNEFLDLAYNFLEISDGVVNKKYAKKWNAYAKELFQNAAVQNVLRQLYDTSKDFNELKMLLFTSLCLEDELTAGSVVDAYRLFCADSKAAMLGGLSILEICLMIAMKHLTEKYDHEPFNFQMMYQELSKFVNLRSSLHQFPPAVVMKAYEHLLELEFIKPVLVSNKVQKEYQMMELLIDGCQVSETLKSYPNLPTEIQQWSNSALF